MKKLIFVALSVYLAQGCAFTTGFTEGVIEQSVKRRPSTADPLHASGPAAPTFGRTVVAAPPRNLPLPASTNPAEYFQVRSLSPQARGAVFTTIDATVEAICTLFSGMYASTDPSCHYAPRRDVLQIVRTKPMINR